MDEDHDTADDDYKDDDDDYDDDDYDYDDDDDDDAESDGHYVMLVRKVLCRCSKSSMNI
mgnify:CR=1 FL=1